MIKLWKHQAEAIERAKKLNGFGLFFEVGTGKTLTAIRMLQDKFGSQPVKPTMILCPPIVIQNWKRELLAHTDIPEKRIIPLVGPGKKRYRLFNTSPKNSIFITNYATLGMVDLMNLFVFWEPHCLVLDESHKCKNLKARRTKNAIRLAAKAKHKFILSGTPILNSMLDIFTQYKILDDSVFGKNYYTFRNEYFVDKNRYMPAHIKFQDWVPKEGADELIREKMATNSMFVEKKDCLDLPPLVKTKCEVELSPKQKKAYNALRDDFIAAIDSGVCTAELAITKGLRLQQIVSGHIPLELLDGKKKMYEFSKNPRSAALSELLHDLTPHHKVIVWAVFKQNYEKIKEVCEGLKIGYVECHGGINPKQKQENVDQFNTDEETRVFIGNPGSAGIGINLIASDISIFYTRNFSLENDQQAEARNYRGGSEIHKKITRIDIVTPGTIDEQVMLALASKKDIGYNVLKGLKDSL